MKKILGFYCFLISVLIDDFLYCQSVHEDVKHVKVYYEPAMYGGWLANNGIWIWDNVILVGFTKGFYKDLGPERFIGATIWNPPKISEK